MDVSGTDNLKPVRSKKEAKERGRNGGVASGKARRRKRAMQDATRYLLDMPIASESVVNSMKALGFDEMDMTNQMAVIVSVWKEAMGGNIAAASWLRDTSGQNPTHVQHQEEFEYKKDKESGITYEMEDMDDIEETIYGKEKEDKQKGLAKSEDDTV